MAQHGVPWAVTQEDALRVGALWSKQTSTWAPIVLWLTDLLSLELSLVLALGIRTALSTWWPHSVPLGDYVYLALAFVAFPIGYTFWTLHPGYGVHPVERMRRTVLITVLLFACSAVGLALIPATQVYVVVLVLTGGFALLLVPLLNALARELLVRAGYWGHPVVILGAGLIGAMVARSLKRERYLGMVPIAFLDDDSQKQHRMVEGVPVIGGLE